MPRDIPPRYRRLLYGPYAVPDARVGQALRCVLRGRNVRVCGWGEGRVRWPLGRVGHGGRGAYVVTAELARAVRGESAAAVCHWWGVGTTTVTQWRRALGVAPFNEGTRRLYAAWKPAKLPDHTVRFAPAALRRLRLRLACGLTQRQVARRMGWTSVNSYGQMETGRRQRATPATLERLARVLGCKTADLTNASPRR